MGYDFTVNKYYKVKKEGRYPAPCPSDPTDTWQLFDDDILTKDVDGTYMCQTGVCRLGIVLKDDEVEYYETPVKLRLV